MKCEARNLMLPRLERDSVKKLHSQGHVRAYLLRMVIMGFYTRPFDYVLIFC